MALLSIRRLYATAAIGALFTLGLIIAGCGGSSASGQSDFSSQVDKIIDAAQTSNDVPSICVAIAKKGAIVYAHCSGMIDIANGTPATPTSIYEIGSITKQFTTTGIMMLANQSPPALALSDPVMKYIPALSTDPTVTIQTMMNMTSGLVDYITLPEAPSWFNGVAPGTVIAAIAPFGLHFPAGTAFEYSNSNIFVLGAVIENITGMTYGNFVQSRVIGPTGLTNITYGPSPTGPNAVGYARDDNGNPVPITPIAPSASYAAGALSADMVDIAKWDWMLLSGQVLPKKLVAQMTTAAPVNGSSHGEPSVYGDGLIVTEMFNRPIVMHGGRIPGFNAITSTFTDTGWSIAAVTNMDLTGYVVDGAWRQIVTTVCSPTSQFRPEC